MVVGGVLLDNSGRYAADLQIKNLFGVFNTQPVGKTGCVFLFVFSAE
jgi:hypothetical protein